MTNSTQRLYPWLILSLLVSVDAANAQLFKKPKNFMISSGLNNGTLNFQDNVASGFSMGFSLNLITIKNFSLSFGTDAKFGFENRYGLGYPAIAAEFLTDGNGPETGYNLAGYGEMPLFLHFNYGNGSGAQCTKKFGFYFGAGVTGLNSGYDNGVINSEGFGFYGLTLEIGICFSHQQFEFSRLSSFTGGMPGIPNPLFFEFTYSAFGFLEKKK